MSDHCKMAVAPFPGQMRGCGTPVEVGGGEGREEGDHSGRRVLWREIGALGEEEMVWSGPRGSACAS